MLKLAVYRAFLVLAIAAFIPLNLDAQTPIPNEVEWNGLGYSLKKIVSNTSIPSGVNFSYTTLLGLYRLSFLFLRLGSLFSVI